MSKIKSIAITEDQEAMLFEMCELLFPEISIDEDSYIDPETGIMVVDISSGKNEYKELGIHWFEFCMTHLANKLYNNIDYTDSDEFNINLHVDLMLDLLNFKTNPIDYLYEQFKNLKQ